MGRSRYVAGRDPNISVAIYYPKKALRDPIKASWNIAQVKLFLNLCLGEVSTNGTIDDTLHGHSWNSIEEKINKNRIHKFTQSQLKGKWDLLKKKYEVLSDLVDNASDYGSDSDHRNWRVERWKDYIKKNPGAKQFCYSDLEYVEEMKLLFDNIRSNERAECGSSKEGLPPYSGGSASFSQAQMESSQINTDAKGPPASSSNDASLPKDNGGKKRSSIVFNVQLERPECGTSKEGLLPDSGGSASSLQAPMESSQVNLDAKGPPASSVNDASLPKDNGGKKRSSIVFNVQLERPECGTSKEGLPPDSGTGGAASPSHAPLESSQMKTDDTDSKCSPASSNDQPSQHTTILKLPLSGDDSSSRLNSGARMAGEYPKEANWKNRSLVKLFIDLCIEEQNKHFIICGSSWDRIGKIILNKKGFKYNEQQLESQWYTLQKKYRAWINLVATATEYGSNPTADHRNWSVERWDDYIKKNPDAKQFCYGGLLEYAEKMKKLFGYISPTKTVAWCTANERSLPISDGAASSSQAAMGSSQRNNDSDSKCSLESSLKDASLPKDVLGKKRSSTTFSGQLERVVKAMKISDGPTIEECNQVLDGMKKLEMDSTIYIAACSIFCESRAHREQWMIISRKSEEVRISWILMISKRLGLL